jgi:dihydrofolate reductase
MRTITVLNHLSLDGVMQAPGGPGEDTRDGFDQGGWAMAGNDEVGGEFLGARMTEGASHGGSLLLGRRTYEVFASYWPKQTDDNPYTETLNRAHKYVVSTTLMEPLPWANSTLLKGEAASTVAQLKQEPGGDLLIMGSGVLVGWGVRARRMDRDRLAHPGPSDRPLRADDPRAGPGAGTPDVPRRRRRHAPQADRHASHDHGGHHCDLRARLAPRSPSNG